MSTSGANPKDTNLQEQYILNRSFDEQFGVQAVEMVGYDSAANVLRRVSVDSSGSLSSKMVNVAFDSIYASYPDAVTEIYAYKLSGSLKATVTVTYQDSTKASITSVVRT